MSVLLNKINKEGHPSQALSTEPSAEVFLVEQDLALRWGISVKTLQAARYKGKGFCGYV